MKAKEKFIADGRIFNSFEEIEKYAKNAGYRITNTTTINKKTGRVYLIDLNK